MNIELAIRMTTILLFCQSPVYAAHHLSLVYTQATSRFGFSAALKQRYLPILIDLILLILSRLRSTNFDSFKIAQNQILKWFGYKSETGALEKKVYKAIGKALLFLAAAITAACLLPISGAVALLMGGAAVGASIIYIGFKVKDYYAKVAAYKTPDENARQI